MSFSRRGRPLAEEEKSTDAAKARARAMELLAGQELSSGQLYERLGRLFTQPTAAAVVAEMVERQYVDDERYARTRAHGLLAARKSRRAAARNLRQKGLSAQQVAAALEAVYAPDEEGENPELSAAVALVESPAGFLIQRRPEKGLLAGLWQPLLWEGAAMTAEQLQAALTALGIHGVTEAKPIPKAKHIFSHIEWRMTGYTVTVEAQPAPDGCIWATREQLQTEYTLPGAFKAYKKRLGLV